ncbi:ATP-binding protein [Williamwhitmania taraxaci]|uniref:4Fe-4S binding domain-containing protein n=1 Tax=Williamwhitmania taraxaci TaxID=1640674 RepID=A0A1G6GQH0_9BACT|nr:4Fe-4S dicluster domain-containing protein [Williamwhitmania taraxaci]SDB84240.1 4Fe-4S binding domain-containing protein [Williamwhitmania taraxaci]
MKREIITIDRDKCNGCGNCITGCHEGALQLIDGKATLVSELMCDGLGACIGTCPVDAISIEVREAVAYDEVETLRAMLKNGKNVIIAHFKHLKDHGEKEYLRLGVEFLLKEKNNVDFSVDEILQEVHNHTSTGGGKSFAKPVQHAHQQGESCGCPGSAAKTFQAPQYAPAAKVATPSALSHWPIQLHLINPNSTHFKDSNLLLAADCVAFSLGAFHKDFLSGKTLAIACPKLDSNKESYVEKLTALIDEAKVDTITIMRMEVPCCGGLTQLVKMASEKASRKIPIKSITVGIEGDIQESVWI